MAVLSLPLSFSNSFWSQDYRKGLDVLYKKLEQVRRATLPPLTPTHRVLHRAPLRMQKSSLS